MSLTQREVPKISLVANFTISEFKILPDPAIALLGTFILIYTQKYIKRFMQEFYCSAVCKHLEMTINIHQERPGETTYSIIYTK